MKWAGVKVPRLPREITAHARGLMGLDWLHCGWEYWALRPRVNLRGRALSVFNFVLAGSVDAEDFKIVMFWVHV